MPDPTIAAALLAIAQGDRETATTIADDLARSDDPLATELSAHLRRASADGVYTTPAGFQAFIDHGSNPALYDATIESLREVHGRLDPRSMADIGPGDGRVTIAVARDDVESIELVEPSAELLRQATERSGWPVPPITHPTTFAGYVESLPSDRHVDLVQSTFALHTTDPAERVRMLADLRPHCTTFAMVDFDVPDFADRGAEHAKYAAERYRLAIEEYRETPPAIEGFLMPVLVAQFDPAAERMTYEQSAESWTAMFTAAGFTVRTRPVFDFWWAPAFLLEATA